MGMETLTLGPTVTGEPSSSVGGVAFGCGSDNGGDSANSTGTVGLGRGPLSLVSQLGFGKFSYCLADYLDPNLTSTVLFGSLTELSPGAGAAAQTTPLVANPAKPSWYYVSLEGISIDDVDLQIPEHAFDLRADGSGGMFVDSGTTISALVESAFRVVSGHVAEFLGQPAVNTSSLEAPCFPAPSGVQQLPAMPDMVFHFAGGAGMRLPRDNYMFFDEENSSFCLAIAGVGRPTYRSVLGNVQ